MRLRPLLLALALPTLAACGSAISPSTTTGSGGGDTTSSSSGTNAPLCQSGQVGFDGSLDGAAVDVSVARLRTRIKGPLFESFSDGQGHVALFAEQALETPGTTAAARGLFRLPQGAPRAGEWFCAGSGSSVTTDAPRTFALAGLARLGDCAQGTPVSGEISACLGADPGLCPLGNRLKSSLDGAAFDWTGAVTGWGGQLGLYEVYLNNGGVLALYIEADTVLGGLLYLGDEAADPGAAYCFGGGGLTPGAQGAIQFSLSGLRRLGTCADAAPVAGALDGCTE